MTAIHDPIPIDNDLLSTLVRGRRLNGTRFEDSFSSEGTLLVFLRHFGCTFCRQMVSEIRNASSLNPKFPKVIFVHQGSIDDGERFFTKFWPEATAIADPDLNLYRAFRIERGSAMQLAGPQTLVSGLKGLLEGHGIGIPMGDPFLMPGLFYVKGGAIVWNHVFRHAGDHPDFSKLNQTISEETVAKDAPSA